MLRSTFRAMGTDAQVLLDAHDAVEGHGALLEARRMIEAFETTLSRFQPTSELSRLNRDGYRTAASDILFDVVELALEAWEVTDGRFDPAIGRALAAAGYDRSFDDLPDVIPAGSASRRDAGPPVTLDHDTQSIRCAPDMHIDLGGIAKGATAEAVADALEGAGPCLVSIGGDIALRGAPSGGSWPISIATSEGALLLGVVGGGIATSGRDRRTWRTTGGARHHVIDPRTGTSADTDVVRITVLAETAVDAEMRATALMLGGAESAITEAEQLGIDAIVTTENTRTLMTGGLR